MLRYPAMPLVPGAEPLPEVEALRKLNQISRALLDERPPEKLLEFVLDAAIELTRAERGFLILLDPDTRQLDARVARNLDKKAIVHAQFGVSRSIIQEAIKTGQAVVLTDAKHDEEFSLKRSVQQLHLASVAAIPLRLGLTVVGVLYLDNRYVSGLFRKHGLTVLETFANQASLALKQAKVVA